MNKVIKKSIFFFVLLNSTRVVSFEEHKHQFISSDMKHATVSVTIPEPAHSDFQVPLIVVPLEQTAPQLAKVIACFGDFAIKQKATQFFQEQKPDALKAFNKAAKKALKPSAHDADQERTFIQKMRDCVQQRLQQEHEQKRAALEQAHQQALQEVSRDARQCRKSILFSTCMTGATFGLAYGIVVLLVTTGTCHN